MTTSYTKASVRQWRRNYSLYSSDSQSRKKMTANSDDKEPIVTGSKNPV